VSADESEREWAVRAVQLSLALDQLIEIERDGRGVGSAGDRAQHRQRRTTGATHVQDQPPSPAVLILGPQDFQANNLSVLARKVNMSMPPSRVFRRAAQ
jgi:hypothetical protein